VLVVWTQPWEYDPLLDPKATLIEQVLSAVQAEVAKNASLAEKLKSRFADLRKRVDVSKAITLAALTAITVSPPSIDQLAAIFSKDSGAEQPTLQGFRDEYATLMGELEGISRVVVLVDDLDRCLPETVVGTLEAIELVMPWGGGGMACTVLASNGVQPAGGQSLANTHAMSDPGCAALGAMSPAQPSRQSSSPTR
jgi:hypothetical protein